MFTKAPVLANLHAHVHVIRSSSMKKTDVAILGSGRAAQTIADKLRAQKKDVLLIPLPGAPEDYFRNIVESLSTGKPSVRMPATTTDTPRFVDTKTLRTGGEEIQAAHYVLASGSEPKLPVEYAGWKSLSPFQALEGTPPRTVTVVGAGPVGIGLTFHLARRGAGVTVLSNRDLILHREEPELAQRVTEDLRSLNVRIENVKQSAESEATVLATGIQPNVVGFGLDKARVYVHPEVRVVVDSELRTSNTRVHALGPVLGPYFNLAYEDYQAQLVAENILAPFFNRQKMFPEAVPSILPFDPPLARIGLLERDAKTKFRDAIAVTVSNERGIIKLVGRKKTTELLGAHIYGKGADALVLYFDLLMRAGIALRDVTEKHHYPSPGTAELAEEAVNKWMELAN